MKILYVFNFATATEQTKLLTSLLTLAGHYTCMLSEVSGNAEFETGLEHGKGKSLTGGGTSLNPKQILFVQCERPQRLSNRFSTREIDYPEVLKGLNHLSWPMLFAAEKIVAKLMGMELPMIYQILTGEVESE